MKFIKNFPELRQTFNYDCGANAMLSVLIYYGVDLTENEVMDIIGTNPKYGTPINGFKKVAKKFSLKYKEGEITIDHLKKCIDKGKPVIIALQAWNIKKVKNWEDEWESGHYVIAVGYDHKRIYFEDPSASVRTYLSYKELGERWHDLCITGKKLYNWGIIFYGKKSRYNPNITIHMGPKG